MILYPKKAQFENDVLEIQSSQGIYLVIFRVDEKTEIDSDVFEEKSILPYIRHNDGDDYRYEFCPRIIGMTNNFASISNPDPALQGQLLTEDNLNTCIIEVNDA